MMANQPSCFEALAYDAKQWWERKSAIPFPPVSLLASPCRAAQHRLSRLDTNDLERMSLQAITDLVNGMPALDGKALAAHFYRTLASHEMTPPRGRAGCFHWLAAVERVDAPGGPVCRGAGAGRVLAGQRFGFTTGWRMLIEQRDASGVMGQLLLLAPGRALAMPLLGHYPESFAALGPPEASGPAGGRICLRPVHADCGRLRQRHAAQRPG